VFGHRVDMGIEFMADFRADHTLSRAIAVFSRISPSIGG